MPNEPDEVSLFAVAYFAAVPSNEMGIRLARRRGEILSGGTSPDIIDRLDRVLGQMVTRAFRTLDLVWAGRLLWAGDAADRAAVTDCVRAIYPVQVLNICGQIDRQFRAGIYPFDNVVTEARIILDWFMHRPNELPALLFQRDTYNRLDTIATFVADVVANCAAVISREVAIETANAIRFSNEVLRGA